MNVFTTIFNIIFGWFNLLTMVNIYGSLNALEFICMFILFVFIIKKLLGGRNE